MEDQNPKKELVKKAIYKYLKEGMFKKDAALLAGISEATFYRWVEEDESFKSRVEANILEYKQSLIQNLNASAKKDGKLALEILRRRWPEDWNIAQKIQYEDKSEVSNKELAEILQKIITSDEETVIQKTNEQSLI